MNNQRVCNVCKINKEYSEYYKHKTGVGGVDYTCKICTVKRSRLRELKNIDKTKINQKIYREKNRDYFNEKGRVYRLKNIDKCRERYRNNYLKNIKTDPVKRFQLNISSMLRSCIKSRLKGHEPKSYITYILGCDIGVFISFIESKFQHGMTWENNGRGSDKWHLDHIEPRSNAKTIDDVKRLNHFTNFQPLWEKDNFRKHTKFKHGNE